MPQNLTDLEINEVSLVDRPANAEIDPATGRKIPRAVVALWKRDSQRNSQDGEPVQKEETMPTPQQIITAFQAGTIRKQDFTRRQITEVIDEQVRKSGNGYYNTAEFAALFQAHEALPLDPIPAPVAKCVAGNAEKRLDAFATEIAKRDGCTSVVAIVKAYEEHPDLYRQAQDEISGGYPPAA
jgi:hypothetical protein